MKKVLVLFSFLLVAGMMNAQAKSCSKAGKKCCASKAKTASTMSEVGNATQVASAISEADVIAAADENIEKRTCEKSGAVSYYQKSVCEKSGSVSWDEVKFCDSSKAFKVASVEGAPVDAHKAAGMKQIQSDVDRVGSPNK